MKIKARSLKLYIESLILYQAQETIINLLLIKKKTVKILF